MKKVQVEPFVESLFQGPLLRRIIAWVLRVVAVVVAFTGLFFAFSIIGGIVQVISYDVPQALGLLIALIVVLAAFFVAVKVLFFRAKVLLSQRELDYPITTISSLLLKVLGELLALFASGAGLVTGILLWFVGSNSDIPGFLQGLVFPAPSFVQGLVLIIASQVYALLTLTFFYLLAELLNIFRNIATK